MASNSGGNPGTAERGKTAGKKSPTFGKNFQGGRYIKLVKNNGKSSNLNQKASPSAS